MRNARVEAPSLPSMEEDLFRAPGAATSDDRDFGRAAIRAFQAQAHTIPAFGRYARHRGADPGSTTDWRAIPPVPTSAFKSHDLSSSPPGTEVVTFETSGTSISKPGRVRLVSTAAYEASLLESFRLHLLPDEARLPVVIFGPTSGEAPRSSLWFMVDRVVERLTPGAVHVVQDGAPRWELADRALARAVSDRAPILLMGTTLLFMAYFQRLEAAGPRWTLPPGSRAMDTGGAKGLRAEFARADVERAFERWLGIPPTHLVNEYGMAEMGSQFYDDNLRAAHEGRPRRLGKQIPPWVRTRVLHPETMMEQPEGASGILVHYDLANVEIPLAIQTEDIGSRVGDRLLVERRLLGAEARGCSLAFEQFIERERGSR